MTLKRQHVHFSGEIRENDQEKWAAAILGRAICSYLVSAQRIHALRDAVDRTRDFLCRPGGRGADNRRDREPTTQESLSGALVPINSLKSWQLGGAARERCRCRQAA